MAPPSSTKLRRFSWTVSRCKILLLNNSRFRRLSLSAANLSPQPLNLKSRHTGLPFLNTVSGPKSLAQVSLVAATTGITLLPWMDLKASATLLSGTISTTFSKRVMAAIISLKQDCTSSSIYAQSLFSCGHAISTALWGAHSAGNTTLFIVLKIICLFVDVCLHVFFHLQKGLLKTNHTVN